MPLLLVYSATLVVAVLVSRRADSTVLSTAVLFLVAGAAYGVLHGPAQVPIVRGLAELALVTVLLTDGMRACLPDLRRSWRLPGRALLVGLPLTLGVTALLARVLVGLDWPQAFLLGAVLSPTDPVFAGGISAREEVPERVRHLLNVESGVNDGLALPFVFAFLSWAGPGRFAAGALTGELLGGIVLGVVLPVVAVRLYRLPVFGSAGPYERLGFIATGLLVYSAASVLHLNAYLAAFAAGSTLGTIAPSVRRDFGPQGEAIAELLKVAAVLVFATLVGPEHLLGVGVRGWAFAVLTLVVARPAAALFALVGSGLPRRERIVVAWFGPKGFASVVYGLLVAASDIPGASAIYHLVAATIVLSIVAHSSTDVLFARWLVGPADAHDRSATAERPARA